MLLSDIFPIPSHAISIPSLAIYFSSHAILKISNRIGKISHKIWEKVGENQEKVGEYRGEFQKSPKKEWDKREKQQMFFSRMSQNLDKNGFPI